jgi:hypothetical protein
MPRIPEAEIDRFEATVSLAALVEAAGLLAEGRAAPAAQFD